MDPFTGLSWVGNSFADALAVGLGPCLSTQTRNAESGGNPAASFFHFRPELRQEHPLNLSISISGGKETNKDVPSNGE